MTTLLLCLGLFAQEKATPIPSGSSRAEITVRGLPIEVFFYKPKSYANGPLIYVAHGVGRNAEEYRDDARDMAENFGALIVVPLLDKTRFPSYKYHRGGLLRADKTIAPRDEWTWPLVTMIIDEVRRREGRPDMPLHIIGHSAGAQFVDRMAAFMDTGAKSLVLMNPGTYLAPTREWEYGWGFRDLGELGDDEHLKRYLAQPITVYLGTADNQRDDALDDSPESDRQGLNRLERGRNTYAMAKKLADERGWPFRWTLVEAPGIAHDHKKMFDSPKCREAVFRDGR